VFLHSDWLNDLSRVISQDRLSYKVCMCCQVLSYRLPITTPAATAEMLIRYREIVIKAARKVDTGIVDIETSELWEKVTMHGVNFDRYLGKKT